MGGIRVHSELAEGLYRFFQEDNDYRLFVEKATERQWGSRHLTFRKGGYKSKYIRCRHMIDGEWIYKIT